MLTVFGYGQGMVMAPLSGAVLSTVKPASAGAASAMYGTTAQIANAAGVAAIGAVYFAIEAAHVVAAGAVHFRVTYLHSRLLPRPHFCHGCVARPPDDELTSIAENSIGE